MFDNDEVLRITHNMEVLAKAGNNLVSKLLGAGCPLLPIPCCVQFSVPIAQPPVSL
jgi:hypothetical protein